ncbi:non-ribosomal peptide synthetase [Pectobacterium betavasculorum]|nr:non-ribosomal peptide synthetase/type I polyketide synthase [Pectobacterium betavasculorum]
MRDIAESLLKCELSNDELRKLLNHLRYSSSEKNQNYSSLVGIGCRYPEGVKSPIELISFMEKGRTAVKRLSLTERFSTEITAIRHEPAVGAFLDEIEKFDPLFFGISPKEAGEIDPQHRLMMLVIQEALEDAGIPANSLRGKSVGVFIASSSDDYQHLALSEERMDLVNVYTSLGTSRSSGAGRISYLMGFTGPSLQLDTSCSSSLVAVHLACQSLAAQECEIAIVAGANLILSEKNIQLRHQLNAVSVQGICRPFDESADGFVQGEGVAAIVLKPGSKAIEDNIPVYLDILASACNHNGGGNGLTAPNSKAQEALLRQVLRRANIAPEDVFYIETHGTGTRLGDPIEVQSINNVYGTGEAQHSPLYIGSSKANFGHLEAGAGLLSLIKTAMAMERGKLPPQVNIQQLNSLIDWEQGRARVTTEVCDWPVNKQGKRIAGISSFGITGTNAHLIVSKNIMSEKYSEPGGTEYYPFLLSAKHPESLAAKIQQFKSLAVQQKHNVSDVCRTLALGRQHFDQRFAFSAGNWSEVNEKLSKEHATRPKLAPPAKGWVFACTGQGSQYPEMGHEWYKNFSVFRVVFDELDKLYFVQRGEYLKDILWNTPDEDKLNDTGVAQPALFAYEYATFRLLESLGIKPSAVIGHSLGEYVAACIAGVFTPEQAFGLVLLRAKLMAALPSEGGMLSVRASLELITTLIVDYERLEVCVVNAQELIVVGGPHHELENLKALLKEKNISAFPLTVSNAFHTVAMEPAMSELTELVSALDVKPPVIPMAANLTGEWFDTAWQMRDYWAKHMRNTVLFYPCVESFRAEGYSHYIEIGPRPVLSQIIKSIDTEAYTLHCAVPGQERKSLCDVLCQLFTLGEDIHWQMIFSGLDIKKIRLPNYPFKLTRCWLESADISLEGRDTGAMKGINEQENNNFSAILSDLSDIFSELLHVPRSEMDTCRSLLESGVDSFIIVMAVKRIKEKFNIKVTVKEIFERYISITKLAEHLVAQGAVSHNKSSLISASLNNNPATSSDSLNTQTTSVRSMPDAIAIQTKPQPSSYHYSAAPSPLQNVYGQSGSEHPVNVSETYVPPQFSFAEDEVYSDNVTVLPNSNNDALTLTQRHYLATFIERYNAKTARSKQQAALNRPHLCNNRKSSSGFRPETKELTYSIQCHASSGCTIRDIDGNEYVDLAMGFGSTFFGHRPQFITDRLQQQINQGYQIGPESHLAGECAKMICQTSGMERVLFTNSGTESVMTAIRIARAAAGRSKVVMFQNAYHGHFDGTMTVPDHEAGLGASLPMTAGTPASMISDVIVLPYNSPQSINYLKTHGHEIAAVVTEPVQNRDPSLHPAEFLQNIRQVTRDNGIILIFDEVLVGYRIALGGAQQWFGIEADMATYGKVIGGGLPLGVVAGKSWIMDRVDGGQWQYNDESAPDPQTTYTAGTFCKHPLAIAACHAVLSKMIEEGPRLQEQLNKKVDELVRILNEVFAAHKVPLQVYNFGSFFRFAQNGNLSFVYQPLELDLFFFHLVEKNIYVWEGKTCFLSTAHTNAHIQKIIHAVNDSVAEMKAAGFWCEAPPPSDNRTFHRQPAGFAKYDSPEKKSEPASILSRAMSSNQKTEHKAGEKYLSKYPSSIADGSFLAKTSTQNIIDFGLYFFGDDVADKFAQILDAARYADDADFHSFWLPERHFNPFGGFAPKPAVISAALANATENIHIRASVLAPLHHPVGLAEEWSVVDNLSHGRAGIALASGWFVNDFVLNPPAWGQQREVMLDHMNAIQHLWKGHALAVAGPDGRVAEVTLHPRPVQSGVPMWLTTLGNRQNYIDAGHKGVGILTNMIGQKLSDLEENIGLYRKAREEAGFDPQEGHITVLLHTLIMDDAARAIETAREPFCNYLNSSVALFQKMVAQEGLEADFDSLSEEDRAFLLNAAYGRYLKGNALIGDVDNCEAVVRSLHEIGVTEIACFVDFGIDPDLMRASFDNITRLKNRFRNGNAKNLHYTSLAPIVTGESGLIQPQAVCEETEKENGQQDILLTLTDDQRMLWFIGQRSQDGMMAFAQTSALTLRGTIQKDAFQKAWQQVVMRHDALRTRIDAHGQQQWIASQVRATIQHIDLSLLDSAQHDAQLQEFLTAESQKTFHFDDLLYRLTLVSLGSQHHVLIFTAHHLICDGVSVGVILTELAACYDAFCQNQPAPQLAPVLQFSEYVRWRHNQYLEKDYQREESFWLNQLAEQNLETLSLPLDYARPVVKTYQGDRYIMTLDRDSLQQLKSFARNNQMTSFMVVLGAFYCLLYRLARQKQVTVGVPFSGRTLHNSETMVGYLSNVYPIALEMHDDETVTQYLQRLRIILLDAYEHQNYPFSSLIEKGNFRRDASSSPLFNVAFNWDRVDIPPMHGLEVTNFRFTPSFVEYDLMINLLEVNEEAELSWDFNTDLFDKTTICHLSRQFEYLLMQFISNPGQPYSQMALEKHAVQLSQIPSASHQAEFVAVSQWLSRCAEKFPDNLAVVDGKRQLSYQQLEHYANKMANRLLQRNIAKGDFVALCLPPSVALLVAIHGVIKAGAAYVPLNTRYPVEKLQAMADKAGAKLVIRAQEKYEEIFPQTTKSVFILDEALEALNKAPKKVCAVPMDADDIVYLIHTSGSTGLPKAVQTTQGNLVSFCYAALGRLKMTGEESFLNVSPASFDMSVPDFFLPLLNGGKVILASEDDRLLPANLVTLLEQYDVNFMQATPTTWQAVVDSGWQGKGNLRACVGGEILSRSLAKALKQRAASVWNGYGPTETTVWSNLLKVKDSDLRSAMIPVGTPLSNAAVYVLDKFLQPVPEGHIGEIYIGGYGVSRGYFNQLDITSKVFLQNPWAEGNLYRTGDLGRFSQNGSISVLGRADTQVKIRGFRIEIGEIEAALTELEGVSTAVARVEQHDSDSVLTAFVELTDSVSVSGTELRSQLKAVLPDYMVPRVIKVMDSLPRSGNDKIDRHQLPALDISAEQMAYVAPATETESTLCSILQDVLGVESISAEADFFEMGGSSLDLVRVQQAIQNQFEVAIQVTKLFTCTTAREIAVLIDEPDAGSTSSCAAKVRISHEEGVNPIVLPVTPTVAYHLQHLGYRNHLNLIKQFDLHHSALTPALMEQAITQLVQRHEALTISLYQNVGDEWVQEVGASRPTLEILDLAECLAVSFQSTLENSLSLMQEQFELKRGSSLARFIWIKAPHGIADKLMLSVHFALADAYGMELLVDQLTMLLRAPDVVIHNVPDERSRYRNWFAAYQQFSHEQALADLSFWHGLPWYRTAKLQCERRTPACSRARFYHRDDYLALMRALSGQHQVSAEQLAELEDSQTIHFFSLDAATTSVLKASLLEKEIELVDALLATYYQLLTPLLTGSFLPIDFMFSNRKPIFKNINITETVMRAAENIILPLDLKEGDIFSHAQQISQCRTGLPHGGLGLPALRFLNSDASVRGQIEALPLPQVGFNYLSLWSKGDADTAGILSPANFQAGRNIGNDIQVERSIWLQLYVDESADSLEFALNYEAHRFSYSEVVLLAKRFKEIISYFC